MATTTTTTTRAAALRRALLALNVLVLVLGCVLALRVLFVVVALSSAPAASSSPSSWLSPPSLLAVETPELRVPLAERGVATRYVVPPRAALASAAVYALTTVPAADCAAWLHDVGFWRRAQPEFLVDLARPFADAARMRRFERCIVAPHCRHWREQRKFDPLAGRAVAYEYHRDGFSQLGQDRVVGDVLFRSHRRGVFVEVGAQDGISISNTYYLEKCLGWRGLLVEPMRVSWDELVDAHRTRSALERTCVSDVSGPQTFTLAASLSGLAAEYHPAHRERIRRELAGAERNITMVCARLSELLARHSLTHVDYLSIDTEGAEHAILSTLRADRIDVAVVSAANNYGSSRSDALMAELGYDRHTKTGVDDIWVRHDLLARFFDDPRHTPSHAGRRRATDDDGDNDDGNVDNDDGNVDNDDDDDDDDDGNDDDDNNNIDNNAHRPQQQR